MAWTYTSPDMSNQDCVRYLLGDTKADMPGLQDEEILFELKLQGIESATPVVYKGCIDTAISCLDAMIASYARDVDYKLGPESVDAGDRVKQLQQLKDALVDKKKHLFGGTPTLVNSNPCPPQFYVGMHEGADQNG